MLPIILMCGGGLTVFGFQARGGSGGGGNGLKQQGGGGGCSSSVLEIVIFWGTVLIIQVRAFGRTHSRWFQGF